MMQLMLLSCIYKYTALLSGSSSAQAPAAALDALIKLVLSRAFSLGKIANFFSLRVFHLT
jgi:hypothetical protein